MLKQQQIVKQQQKLSPLQIQQAKLLELTTLELENRIDHELEDNPALEEDKEGMPERESLDASDNPNQDDLSLGDYRTEDDIPGYRLQQYYTKEGPREEIPYSEEETFQEYLTGQLRLKDLTPEEFRIGEYLIGNLDSDGYLRRSSQDISNDLAFQYNIEVSPQDIDKVADIIKELDPAGVGAFNLQECLLIQLHRKEKTPARELAINILTYMFDAFSKKQYDKMMKSLGVNEEELKEAIKEITALNPRPGASWERAFDTKMSQIAPDFYVEAINGELAFSMPDKYIPELKINHEFADILHAQSSQKKTKTKAEKEALQYVKQKVDSANWFINAIKQRNATLEKTMLAIMQVQREFFLTGEESSLKPMILKDIAEMCGYDISTISRVSNSKYVQTNWGIYPLKYFFSEGMINEEGEEISTREIKAILKECIEAEDKSKPLTDEALEKELKKKGYDIARRTVAKYREQMGIPIARLRKTI